MKSRNNEGNEQKKKQHGKTNGKKMISVVLTLLLAVSTIAASFSGVNYIGARSTMDQLSGKNNISENGKLEESLKFQRITDGYLQALKLYLTIRCMGSADGSLYTGKLSDMPFLKTGGGSDTKVLTVQETAELGGHNYDYSGYFKNFQNGFGDYSIQNISIDKLASTIFSLKDEYFAGGKWDSRTLYYTVASGKNPTKKQWKKVMAESGRVATNKLYDGQETLLPSLQKESGRKTETVMVPFEKAAQKVPLKSSYAKWLNQAYPGYASGWLLYQSALACENNFEGTGEDGVPYEAYRSAVMADYKKAYGVGDMYEIEGDHVVNQDGLVYIFGQTDVDHVVKMNEQDTLYYKGGTSSFTLKNFFWDPNAYYENVSNDDDWYVYEKSLKDYAAKLKKTAENKMGQTAYYPWVSKMKKPLCNEAAAADMAQFCLSFGSALEKFLEESGFWYSVSMISSADGDTLSSKNAHWNNMASQIQHNLNQDVKDIDCSFAAYDARGEVYSSNWFCEGFHNSGNLKEFLAKLIKPCKNAVIMVGYNTDEMLTAGKNSVVAKWAVTFKQEQQQYRQAKAVVEENVIALIVSVLLMIVAFMGLVLSMSRVATETEGESEKKRTIPAEVFAVVGVAGLILICGAVEKLMHLSKWEQNMEKIDIVEDFSVARPLYSVGIAILAMLVMAAGFELLRRLRQNRLAQNSILCWCGRKGKAGGVILMDGSRLFLEKYKDAKATLRYGSVMIIYLILWIFVWICCISMILGYGGVLEKLTLFIALPLLLIVGEYALAKTMFSAIADEKIREGALKIAQGDIMHRIELPEKAGKDQKELADTINHIRQGLESAVDESVRSERMKTELITNVSHDIKTPLTSVINYVDLLKREHIDNERVQEYLDILDRKSLRLKELIEDLVEASKASSGTIDLQITTLNFGELVNQTNGEFEEKFAKAGLTLVADVSEKPICFQGDGRRVFRILENLYGNVTKYALEGTRVYVTLSQKEDSETGEFQAVFSIKNISRDQLTITPQELTERFVRGDESRTTDGSGLGLYIASNLTELMGGTFEIHMDGDLFRVTVSFPAEKRE